MPHVILNAKALKCTLVLNPSELAGIADPAPAPRVSLHVRAGGSNRTVVADVSAKSFRKAKATIAEHGADSVAAIIQGKLEGNAVIEAGLVVTVKPPKPAEASTAGNGSQLSASTAAG